MKIAALVLLSVLFGGGGQASSSHYRDTLMGTRLVPEGSRCAGMAFRKDGTLVIYDELICGQGEAAIEARLRGGQVGHVGSCWGSLYEWGKLGDQAPGPLGSCSPAMTV